MIYIIRYNYWNNCPEIEEISSLDPCRIGDGTNVKIGVDATMVMGEEKNFVRAGWD